MNVHYFICRQNYDADLKYQMHIHTDLSKVKTYPYSLMI